MCARNLADLENTAKELQNTASTIHYKQVDISKKNEVIDFANWCLGFGVPTILINNAGSFLPGSIHNEAENILEQMIETNLYSAYHLTRELLPQMMQKKTRTHF